jgi:2-polyprenyl-3-methyl-5-hydroxy-6-metoxy-1,4-benzoquinol methylase
MQHINPLSDAKIVDSWLSNAAPWIEAIREEQIESRKLVTNQAIIEAIISKIPKNLLDIGCGEGWLARALFKYGIDVLGIDATPALITQAQKEGGGDFQVMSYEEFAQGKLSRTFDAVASNFALLGKESVEDVFRTVPSVLNQGGYFFVQTIHPLVATDEQAYEDGWRSGSWAGFSSQFTDPAPWYFRTLESWIKLFESVDLRIREMREPKHPKTNKPASVLFIAQISAQ